MCEGIEGLNLTEICLSYLIYLMCRLHELSSKNRTISRSNHDISFHFLDPLLRPCRNSPKWAKARARATRQRGFPITLGRTPLDEWSPRRRDLYLSTHNTRKDSLPRRRRDSNPQSQQASGRRPTLYTALPLGHIVKKSWLLEHICNSTKPKCYCHGFMFILLMTWNRN